ncbi:hypothetical protein TB2_014822 [Malus domestica]
MESIILTYPTVGRQSMGDKATSTLPLAVGSSPYDSTSILCSKTHIQPDSSSLPKASATKTQFSSSLETLLQPNHIKAKVSHITGVESKSIS